MVIHKELLEFLVPILTLTEQPSIMLRGTHVTQPLLGCTNLEEEEEEEVGVRKRREGGGRRRGGGKERREEEGRKRGGGKEWKG